MNFPEDVPNSSQSFMSFVDQVYFFFKTCTYSLFIYTLSIKLFVPSTNIQSATPNSSLLAYALIFPAFLFLGARMKISVLTDISVLEFYGYIGYIGDISVYIFT